MAHKPVVNRIDKHCVELTGEQTAKMVDVLYAIRRGLKREDG